MYTCIYCITPSSLSSSSFAFSSCAWSFCEVTCWMVENLYFWIKAQSYSVVYMYIHKDMYAHLLQHTYLVLFISINGRIIRNFNNGSLQIMNIVSPLCTCVYGMHNVHILCIITYLTGIFFGTISSVIANFLRRGYDMIRECEFNINNVI